MTTQQNPGQISNSPEGSSLSCSPLESRNDTALPSKAQSLNAATEQNRSASALCIQHCKALRERESYPPGQEQKLVKRGVTRSVNTSVLRQKVERFCKTFSPFKRNCSPGGVSSGCYQLITTRIVVEPLALLLFPTVEDADNWMGDLSEKRLRLKNSGYYDWAICVFDLCWSADLAYHFVIERVKMLML